jgi:hypothetical protein
VAGLLTSVNINDKTIVFKELKLKDYKNILKCLIGNSIDQTNLFLNLNSVLKKITNLSKEEILNLNLAEYLLLLIYIRVVSIGSSIFGVYKNAEHSINVEITLDKTINELEQILKQFAIKTYKDETVTITVTIPSIKTLLDKKNYPHIKEDINILPLKYLKKVNSLTDNYHNFLKQFYFFKSPLDKYCILFDFDINSYTQLIKILFNEDLLTVYDNIFYLSKLSQISSTYLENCTYGEFKIYVKKIEELYQKTSQPSSDTIQEPLYEPINIDSLYDADIPTITRSEFTP